jgi:hypothetical protein
MKNRKKLWMYLLLMLVMTIAVFPLNAQAASSKKWTKACKAYKTWLAKNESTFEVTDFTNKNPESYKKTAYFNIVDLDGNGVPELITYHNICLKNADVYIFTYKGGKVTRVRDSSGKAFKVNTCYWANGSFGYWICKNSHLHIAYSGSFDRYEYVYSMKSGKVQMSTSPTGCAVKKNGYLMANNKKYRKKLLK